MSPFNKKKIHVFREINGWIFFSYNLAEIITIISRLFLQNFVKKFKPEVVML